MRSMTCALRSFNSFSKWIGVDIWGLIVLIAANRIGNREMINPAIALPLGLMRRPIIENISPNNHKFPEYGKPFLKILYGCRRSSYVLYINP